MKIVCDSCSAKYSIADEKVAGRVFKIRCKKCGAAIVVRGDQQAGGGEAAAAGGYDYGGESVWHAVVEGDQQGPFSPAQLGQMISAGTIGWDAYVWREGFDDWKPAQDVEELVQAIMNPGGAPAESADAFAEAEPAPAAAAAPVASKRDAGADLFAPSSTSPFGGGDDEDVVASSPSPRVSAQQAMTGQRNENSVLFSLSNLQALATGGGGGGPAPSSAPKAAAPKAGMAAGEGSGLIDIRALASATGIGSAPAAAAAAPSAPKVDDLLSIGAPSVGLGSALAAPVIIPDKKPEKTGNGGLIGAVLGGFLVLGVAGVAAAYILRPAEPTTPPTAIAPGATPPAAPAPAAAAAAVTPAATTPAAPAVGTTTAPAAAAATPAAPTAPAVAEAPASEGSSARRRSGPSSGGSSPSSSSSSSASAPAPAAAAAAPTGAARRPSTSSSSIDDLLEGAIGGGGRRPAAGGGSAPAAAPAGGGGGGPEVPGRSDVVSAMQGVTPAIQACGNGEHGTATVSVTVQGSTGRVTSANVTGQFAGTPVGSCIAREVRSAHFPTFTRPTFTVAYPFRI